MTIGEASYLFCKITFQIEENIQIIQTTRKEDKRTKARKENILLSTKRIKLKNSINNYFSG